MSNTAIWDVLSKTDPAHTKGFNRSGGFKGTAIKPQWVVSRLTEQFGPVGVGWGMGEPSFETVTAGSEVLVYCTVSAWHTDRANTFYGVGGDKVMTQRSNGTFVDDEAFKKAYTDAIMNAFKFLGVAADVHMGLFDDSKYVQEMKKEFETPPEETKRRDTGPAPVEGKDFWKCDGPGMSAYAAKNLGLDKRHEEMRVDISSLTSAESWREWCSDNQPEINTMPPSWRMLLRDEAEERGRFLGAIND